MKRRTLRARSPLRYPGGKTRALNRILPLVPPFEEFREPMVGGGSVFFALKQLYPDKKYWINDINTDLYLFWKYCKEQPAALVSEISKLKSGYKHGRKLHLYLKSNKKNLTELQRASRFFVLNRISFSGLVDSGGYSEEAFKKRFTASSIQRIFAASKALQGVKITNMDYEKVVSEGGKGVFIFLDPPYMSNAGAKLYGEKGTLHINFNHACFAGNIRKCRHNWLITYDNCSGVQKLYDFDDSVGLTLLEWKLQYGFSNCADNVDKKKARIGDELFIFNYNIKGEKDEII
jgi:DNA adenine methylase